MKTRDLFFAALLMLFAFNAYSQSEQSATITVIESQMILPKMGMEDKFEAAILAHNKKFHPEGPYVAGLRRIEYGPKAGWYLWVMGPTAAASLDTRPAKENGHDLDWSTNIDPLVAEYGETYLLSYEPALSFGFDIFNKTKHYELWAVAIKTGQYYRFKALAEKLQKVYAKKGNQAFIVFTNALHQPGEPDVILIWPFDTYDGWFKDMGPKADYEKMYGEGSWENLMKEWYDVVVDYSSDIRTRIF